MTALYSTDEYSCSKQQEQTQSQILNIIELEVTKECFVYTQYTYSVKIKHK